MADKIIKVRLDVTQLNKDYFFKGEKGTYADVTILFNESKDKYGCNGMVVQDVPKNVRDKNSEIKGNILGNCKVFSKGVNQESIPSNSNTDFSDLPF